MKVAIVGCLGFVSRLEVYEVMKRGGYSTVTAVMKALFPRMVKYWIKGNDFVFVEPNRKVAR